MTRRGVVALAAALVAIVALASPPAGATTASRTGRVHRADFTCTGTWTVDPTPNRAGSPNELYAAFALSSSNIWAVGRSAGGTTLAEHDVSGTWSIKPTPSVGAARLLGVAATGPNNVWAVGTYQQHGPTAIAMRWDGATWTRATLPSAWDSLDAIATGPAGIWAVGYAYNQSTFSDHTLIVHRVNGKWVRVPSWSLPGNVDSSQLFGVAEASAKLVWAVGYEFIDGSIYQLLLEKWNGKSWSHVSVPAFSDNLDGFAAVTAPSATTALPVGFSTARPIGEYDDGTTWSTRFGQVSPGLFYGNFNGATTDGAGTWAVGEETLNGGAEQTLVNQWNGSGFVKVTTPNPTGNDILNGVTGTGNLTVAVGSQRDDAGVVHTLAEYEC